MKFKFLFIFLFAFLLIGVVSAEFEFNENTTHYYNMDEQTGSVLDFRGIYNLTNSGAVNTTGIVKTAYDFERSDGSDKISGTSIDPDNFNSGLSYSFWFKPESINGTQDLFDYPETGSFGRNYMRMDSSGNLGIRFGCGISACEHTISNVTLSTGNWYMLTMTHDTSFDKIYVNGVLIDTFTSGTLTNNGNTLNIGNNNGGTAPVDGIIDEFGIWNTSISQTVITGLYNGGLGPIDAIVLTTPSEGLNVFPDVTFTGNVKIPSVKNVTLIIDGIKNQTNSSGLTNSDYSFTASLPIGSHNWSMEVCDTSDSCSQPNDVTFSVVLAKLDSTTYNSEVIEGSSQNFVANISTSSSLSSVNLVYNGTSHSSNIQFLGGSVYNVTNTINLPAVTINENATFFYEVNLANGEQFNSSSLNQTILDMGIDNCSVYTNLIFNYTLYDERLQTPLTTGPVIEIDIVFKSVSDGSTLFNISSSYSDWSAPVCFSQNLTGNSAYIVDSTVKHTATDHEIEYYNIRGFNLNSTSIPQTIKLYSLLTTESTQFQITFKDSSFIPVEGALVTIMRQYVSEGVFKTVEIPITDSNGQTIAHMVERDIVYNILVTKDGSEIASFNNIIAFCEDITIGQCTLNLNAIQSGGPLYEYEEQIKINANLDYNSTSRVLVLDFSTFDGSSRTVRLVGTKVDDLGNETACNESLTSSSGSITCTVPSAIGNSTLYIEIFVDEDLSLTSYVSLGDRTDFGTPGFFFVIIFVLSMSLMMISSKTGIVIGVIIGLIGSISLGILSGNALGITSSVIWLVIAGSLLIWRMNREGST